MAESLPILPLSAKITALRGVGYDGWYVIEQDTAPDPTAVAKANLRYLEGLLAG